MTSKPQKLSKERAYLLLYGLLDDKEAEETRSLVANDSDAATVFETARANVDLFKDLVRVAYSDSPIDDARNVAVEPRLSLFAYDAAVGSFEEGVFSTSVNASDEQIDVDEQKKEDSGKGRFHRKLHRSKKSKIRKEDDSSANTFLKQDRGTRNITRFNAFIGSSELLARAVCTSAGRMATILWRSPIFVALLTGLLVLLIAVTLGALRRDQLLARYFFDDFRIQVALPRTLARGVSQAVVVKKTGVDGRARRVPVRFCFSDPASGKLILARTESGNGDGNLVYEFPDLVDFPDVVELTIYAGSGESEVCQTKLPVVNFEEQIRERRGAWTQPDAANDDGVTNLVSPVFRDALESLIVGKSLGENDSESSSGPNVNLTERVFVRFYPETGRFISDFNNRISVFCSDKEGRPLAKSFLVFQQDLETPIASFSTSKSGFGRFEWAPVEEAALIIKLVDNEEKEDDSTVLNPFASGIPLGSFQSSNGMLCESPATVEIDTSTGRDFTCFLPPVVRGPAYFSLNTQTPDFTEMLKARLSAKATIPLIATVEKYGVTVWQRFLTVSRNNDSVDLALPDSLSGLLKVSLYSVAQRKFLKIAETTVFRLPESALTPDLKAGLVESHSDSGQRKLVVRVNDRNAGKSEKNSFWNEGPVMMNVFWAPDHKRALALLDADDVLTNMDESFREETVETTSDSLTFNPPVVFDNLDRLVKSTRSKLELFKENEAKSFIWTVRLVFVGCLAVAIVSLFFAIFRAFSLGRCVLLCVLAGLLWGYAYRLQNTLEVFFESSQDVVFAIDEEESQRAHLEPDSFRKRPSSPEVRLDEKKEAAESAANVRLTVSDEIGPGVSEYALDNILNPEERKSGLLLIKLDNGVNRSGAIVSLEDASVDHEE